MKHLTHSFRVLVITAVVAACLTAVSATYMWFTANDSVENAMALGRQSVVVTEDFTPGDPVYPGDTKIKKVSFTNEADYGALIRVRYDEFWIAKDGSTLSNVFYDDDKSEWVGVMVKNWNATTSIYNPTFWTDGHDGYFYYNKVLEPGVTTDPILDSVTFNKKLLETSQLLSYTEADYTLTFTVDSVVYTVSDASIKAQFGSHVSASVANDGTVTWTFV